eukprot:19741-Heterococcus_DN1.PRE.3
MSPACAAGWASPVKLVLKSPSLFFSKSPRKRCATAAGLGGLHRLPCSRCANVPGASESTAF